MSKPSLQILIRDNLIKILDDGSFQLNMDYFDYATGLTMTNKKFEKLFGEVPRRPEAKNYDVKWIWQPLFKKLLKGGYKISENIQERDKLKKYLFSWWSCSKLCS